MLEFLRRLRYTSLGDEELKLLAAIITKTLPEMLSRHTEYAQGYAAGRGIGSKALFPGCSYRYGAGVVHGALERLDRELSHVTDGVQ